MDPGLSRKENEYYEMFGERYEYLLDLYKRWKEVEWRYVVFETMETLKEYDNISRDINLNLMKDRKDLLPGGKRSINCVAVVCSLFCAKFHDIIIESDISPIIDSLHQNITCFLEHLSHSIVAVRMVEIMLYVMATIREDYEDTNIKWRALAADCFRHQSASNEIKLASAILICELDEHKKFIDFEMCWFLHNILISGNYLGFKKNDIKYAITQIEDSFTKQIEDALYDMFGKRYEYLLTLRQNIKETELWDIFMEMQQTLREYGELTKDSSLYNIKRKREILPSGKRSINCLAVCSTIFSTKFEESHKKLDVSDISTSLFLNVTTLLPYLSHGVFVVRIVEIMLYVMATIREQYKDKEGKWSTLTKGCFGHPNASDEIKLAATILICEFDIDKKIMERDMFDYLNNLFLKGSYLGFKLADIRRGLSRMQEKFSEGFYIKKLDVQQKDSGYADADIEDSVEEIEQYKKFGKRYQYLLDIHRNKIPKNWPCIVTEMQQTLRDYDLSMEINLHRIKKRKELLPSCKRSVNCLAVSSTLFSNHFQECNTAVDMGDICESLRQNIKSLLPYLSHGIYVVRIVEIMLYVMATIREQYKDKEGKWSTLAKGCFCHPNASDEIKLAATILICEFDIDKKIMERVMFDYLNNLFLKGTYLGFKLADIKRGLSRMQEKFSEGFYVKESDERVVTSINEALQEYQPRKEIFVVQSRFSDQFDECPYNVEKCKTVSEGDIHTDLKKLKLETIKNDGDTPVEERSMLTKILSGQFPGIISGTMITLAAMWLYRRLIK